MEGGTESGGGQDVGGEATWSGVRRLAREAVKEQRKADRKGGGSERAEIEEVGDGALVRGCAVKEEEQSKNSGKNKSSRETRSVRIEREK